MSIQNLLNKFAEGMTPPPDWSVAEWSDRRRFLAAESSAEPGRWKTDRTPYLREPMEAATDPNIETITLLFASQTGKSELIFNIIGYHADLDPCPMMMVQPTVEMAQAVSKDRITPLFRDSPHLAKKLVEQKERKGSQTVLQKQFPGGHLTMVGANAPAGLASRPIRVVLCDEVDRYPMSAGEEGDPILLAVRRTASFAHNKKIIITSTPGLKGLSRVEKSFLQSDQRHLYCPCPHCDYSQTLKIENVDVSSGTPTAGLVCENEECGVVWSEADRLEAIDNGVWVAHAPEITDHAGFFLNGLYSPWYTVPSIMKEHAAAKGDPSMWRTFVNTVLSLPFADDTDHIEESELVDRMVPLGLTLIPELVLAITAGVDIQKDRAEIIYMGWTETQSYVLEHEIVYGDPTGLHLWDSIDESLGRRFRHALGGEIGVDAAAIDSGNWAQDVYNYCAKRMNRGYYAIKGVGGDKLIWQQSKIKLKQGCKLFLIGVDTAKTKLMTRLKISDPDKESYMHLCDQAENSVEFINQMLSEMREVKLTKNGRPEYVWHRKPGRRAEVLDCTVYAMAARETIKPNWIKRQQNLTVHSITDKPKKRGWGDVAKMYD